MADDSKALFDAGNLSEAIAAALSEVKSKPTDTTKRSFLCSLLCFAGDFERADRQLDTISKQDTKSAVSIGIWRGILRGEVARQQFYVEGRMPEFLSPPPAPREAAALKASIEIREGDVAAAAKLLDCDERKSFKVAGSAEDESSTIKFEEFRDWDDITSCTLEVIASNGKFFWIPMADVHSLEFEPVTTPRDLIWRQATISVENGPDGEVYLPALYPGSAKHESDDVKLGRVTDWVEQGDLLRGVGVRMFALGEENRQILQLKSLKFDRPSE